MKKPLYLLVFALISVSSYAQQATEIDPKFVKLPRYADMSAINAIPSPQQGMMVYNVATTSNWSFNGSAWTNIGITIPLNLTNNTSIGYITTFASETTGSGGRAGYFGITNPLNSQSALTAITSGTGDAFYAGTIGPGYAVRVSTSTGKAALFENPSITNFNTTLTTLNYGNAGALNAINYGMGPSAIIEVDNVANSSTALEIKTNALGKSGEFRINNTLNNSPSLVSTTNGSGDAINGITTGSGKAGSFEINNSSNPNLALSAATNGLGSAGKFNISNPSNSSSAIEAKTLGSGFAGTFSGANAIQANGLITNKGFTQLGELSPVIKTVAFGEYIGAGSVQTISHNLAAKNILSINVFALLESGVPPELRIPPSFLSLGTEYYYDYYFDDDKIYFIIPSTSTKVKNFFAKVLITYTE